MDNYNFRRFGGRGGSYVNRTEREIVSELIASRKGTFLDLACGTGRFIDLLAKKGLNVIAADYSLEMLRHDRRRIRNAEFVRCDAFHLPFREAVFHGLVSIRFIFHYPEIHHLLREMVRVTRMGGIVVFDTYTWSPRSIFSRGSGKRVSIHSKSLVEKVSATLGLTIVTKKRCFLFSPLIYRFLPYLFVRMLVKLENLLSWIPRVRIFWLLQRVTQTS